ncbi:pentapeptide repeat-containing protein [Nocardioides marinquilinus]|uniref:Pentapeptide repeat-containing protein n=1 Tax=Nocardioides marinquilinus TaxID=1210400 RepID=A0ABP9PZE1_9ACTN
MTPPAAPAVDEPVLGDLADGDPAELTRDADLYAVRYAGHERPDDDVELASARLDTVAVEALRAETLDLRGARLGDVVLGRLDVTTLRAARGRWRGVRVSGRLGVLEAYESELQSVRLVGCRLGYVNLRSAELTDVVLTDCVVDELDLGSAVLRRVALERTRVAGLDVQHAELHDVDLRGAELSTVAGLEGLRGATVSEQQLTLLAPLLAAAIGLHVVPAEP